ncbi:MAG: acetyl-CoA carboxylase biotin carboxyl carrier protein [Clostridiales bacterium]|nr:acetyl-CoA carboxylase biotin carboxyl carrier protein [Clostridiales bacterium]
MKLELDEIFALIDKVTEAGLASFRYEDDDIGIQIKGRRTAAGKYSRGKASLPEVSVSTQGEKELSAKTQDVSDSEGNIQKSPLVGVFYTSDSEGGEPLVRVGDKVEKGQVIGIVEAMKLMNEIRSEYSGTVEEVLAENGQVVEFGQPLFRIGR